MIPKVPQAHKMPGAHPLRCSFSRMDSASTAMQDTISCDITCPCEFHTSHRLGPSMSITCAAPAPTGHQSSCSDDSLYLSMPLWQNVQIWKMVQPLKTLISK